jgi:peroxiredoxin
MLAAGDRVPDATVWLSSREQARVTEIAGDGPILLFFYLFDWSAT